MTPQPFIQRNAYKGTAPRCWARLRFAAPDGSLHERELLADTGCPCAVIVGQADLTLLVHAATPSANSNFGPLMGGWIELSMPELGLATLITGFGSDQVLQAVQLDSPDFAGLIGLPLLRLVEYGGDASSFWLRKTTGTP